MDPAEQALGKSAEDMTPQELVSYLRLSMRDKRDLDLRIDGSGVKERSVMTHLQKVYGRQGAGLIVRWAVYGKGGECDGKPLTFFSFQKERKWWTDEVYAEAQQHRTHAAQASAWVSNVTSGADFLKRFSRAQP